MSSRSVRTVGAIGCALAMSVTGPGSVAGAAPHTTSRAVSQDVVVVGHGWGHGAGSGSGSSVPMAALQAQAVAARSYAQAEPHAAQIYRQFSLASNGWTDAAPISTVDWVAKSRPPVTIAGSRLTR